MMSDGSQWVQVDLFGMASETLEEGIRCLDQFHWQRARSLFEKGLSIDPYLANGEFHRRVAEMGVESGLTDTSSPEEIVRCLDGIRGCNPLDGEMEAVPRRFSQLLSQRLIEMAEQAGEASVQSDGSAYPVGALYLLSEQPRKAFDRLSETVRRAEEASPRVWGYYADAASALGYGRKANLGYLRLLAGNPWDIDWRTFRHPGLRQCFKVAAERWGLDHAYPLWGYHAWEEGWIAVPPQNRFLAPLLEQWRAHEGNAAEETRLQAFTLHVLVEQSQLGGPVDPHHRERMQALAPELFKRYLRQCENG